MLSFTGTKGIASVSCKSIGNLWDRKDKEHQAMGLWDSIGGLPVAQAQRGCVHMAKPQGLNPECWLDSSSDPLFLVGGPRTWGQV